MNTHTQDQIRQMFDWWTVNVIHMNWSLVSVMIVFSRTLVSCWTLVDPEIVSIPRVQCPAVSWRMWCRTPPASLLHHCSCPAPAQCLISCISAACSVKCAVHWPPNNHQDWGYWTLISASTPLHQYDELFLVKVQMKSFNLLNFLAVQYLLFYFYIHVTSLFIITINACDAIVSKRKAYRRIEPNASKLYNSSYDRISGYNISYKIDSPYSWSIFTIASNTMVAMLAHYNKSHCIVQLLLARPWVPPPIPTPQ